MMYSAACILLLAACCTGTANGQTEKESTNNEQSVRKGEKKGKESANSFHEDFPWKRASKGEDYHFYGELEMCGDVATKAVFPNYLNDPITGEGYGYGDGSGNTFAYKLPGSTAPCGSEGAPLIHLIPGKIYKLILINNTKSPTNLHTHGLHIGGNGYSDDAFRVADPGMCLEYIWAIDEHHMAGVHWYHPHKHHYTFETVKGGAFGFMVVEETKNTLETYPKSVQKWLNNDHEVLLLIGKHLNPSPIFGFGTKCIGTPTQCATGTNTLELCSEELCRPNVNHKRLETVTVVEGEWYRFVIANIIPNGEGGDAIKFYQKESGSIEKSSCEVLIAGYDGVYRFTVPRTDYPEDVDYFPVTGSSRLELAVKCTEDAFMRAGHAHGDLWDWQIDDLEHTPVLVNIKVVEGKKSEASPWADEEKKEKWVTTRPDYLQNFCDQNPDEFWSVTPSAPNAENGGHWVVNGLPWNGAVPIHTMTYNTVQEWAYHDTSGGSIGHPMHTHVWHQQICGTGTSRTDSCGLTMEYGQFVDSTKITDAINDPCYTRFKTVKYSGKVVIHCHDLLHEDFDMMGWVNTVGGPDNIPDQAQASCDAVRQQVKGKKGNKTGNGGGNKKGKGKKGVVG